ncbi:MAG TPA: antibiotic biosynthesis monooxygenase [Candidatus Limnocylindrales bacterium]|nr:antibiotic biosynthesis monooxygenase [Candidatus Limnocylindrales bacterium]
MIVRILTARVPRNRAEQFESVLRSQLPLMRAHDGLVYVKLARQAHATYDDILLFEEWRDAAALYGWAGSHLERPRLLPGAEGLADRVAVTHYEALDREIDSVVASSLSDKPADMRTDSSGGSPD